ncbi:MAG: ATP-binding protein [Alphaproteobacteria bacterium]|nr:ATP-binding protein [Alphaproteobacteria bacterium]
MKKHDFQNPFRPGAGHVPPYLAGRTAEQNEVRKLLDQKIVMENIILTGLRGVGKTVLLESLKPIAREKKWLWAGTDLSESASITESNIAIRILADVSLITSTLLVRETRTQGMGFTGSEKIIRESLNYDALKRYFDNIPGLIADKLKATLELVWAALPKEDLSGIVFAYDEAQNLADYGLRHEYPLSLLLEVFQSLQRKNIPFLLLLTGLPTLFPKLVEARTYSERMFNVIFLGQLDINDSRDAIVKPIEDSSCPIQFSERTVNKIIEFSGGYPYFIQFIGREVYDAWINKINSDEIPTVLLDDIIRKLDTSFFQGRWAKATDRQRDLLMIIPSLPNCDGEFTVQEISEESKKRSNPFSPSHVNQMLSSLAEAGLVYKNRHGRYSLAVPLLSRFIKRQMREAGAGIV